jgi:hypothetical protein
MTGESVLFHFARGGMRGHSPTLEALTGLRTHTRRGFFSLPWLCCCCRPGADWGLATPGSGPIAKSKPAFGERCGSGEGERREDDPPCAQRKPLEKSFIHRNLQRCISEDEPLVGSV